MEGDAGTSRLNPTTDADADSAPQDTLAAADDDTVVEDKAVVDDRSTADDAPADESAAGDAGAGLMFLGCLFEFLVHRIKRQPVSAAVWRRALPGV